MKKTQNGFISVVLVIVVLLAATGGIYFYIKNNPKIATTEGVKVGNNVESTGDNTNKINNIGDTKDVATNSTTKSEVNKGTNDVVSTGKNDDLWTVFDKSVLALKNKDVASYNLYSYRQVSTGEESQFKDFSPMMHEQASKIRKSDYINKWQDDKQAIYSTNLQQVNLTDYYGYKKGIIMFINKNGVWKVLSFGEPQWGITAITTIGGPKRTQTEADKELLAMTLDSDKDGLTDMDEKCEGAKKGDKQCVKTDPNKRDTNGGGWWDGINEVIR